MSEAERFEQFILEHRNEIRGLVEDRYYRNGGWNGAVDALNEVIERYNFTCNFDSLQAGEFEQAIRAYLF